MDCNVLCVLGIVLIIGKIYFLFSMKKYTLMSDFINELDNKQKMIYFNIIKERSNIYFQGMLLGLLLGFIYLLFIGNARNSLSSVFHEISKNVWGNVFAFVGIVFITNNIYYILKPKTTYMLNHITKPNQVDAWLDIYKHMQHRCMSGVVVGIVGYGILSYSYLKN